MGAGPESRIFAEPTTWTGSIGVIIPHYEVVGLAEKLGVEAAPLKTGEFKDALSPFRPMTDRDKEVWGNILNQAFEQFVEVIDQGRPKLDAEQVRALATGQIYTAKDARENGLVDELGYEEDALDALQKKTGLADPKVIEYESPSPVWTWLIGLSPRPAASPWPLGWEGGTPRALYLFSAGGSDVGAGRR
jgi:protease-4